MYKVFISRSLEWNYNFPICRMKQHTNSIIFHGKRKAILISKCLLPSKTEAEVKNQSIKPSNILIRRNLLQRDLCHEFLIPGISYKVQTENWFPNCFTENGEHACKRVYSSVTTYLMTKSAGNKVVTLSSNRVFTAIFKEYKILYSVSLVSHHVTKW